MNRPPEFHLCRVESDGTEGPVEIFSWSNLPSAASTSRRGFVRTGIAVGAFLGLLGARPGLAKDKEKEKDEDPGVVNAHRESVENLAFTPDGRFLVSSSADLTVKLWAMPQGALETTLKGHRKTVRGLAVTPDGKQVVSTSLDKTLNVWSIPDGKLMKTLETPGLFDAVVVSADGKTAIAAGQDKSLRFWSIENDKLITSVFGHSGPVNCIARSQDGGYVTSGSTDKRIKVWKLPEATLHRTLNGHEGKVEAICFSRDGQFLASGGWDRTVRIWVLKNDSPVKTFNGHKDGVTSAAFTPDGAWLVSGSWDHDLRLWSMPEGEVQKTLTAHRNKVNCLAISPDGKLLASGDQDGVILIWSLPDGQCLGFLFDADASQTDAYVYTMRDPATQREVTYTLPCGTPLPPAATCVCNCVPGNYQPPTPIVRTQKPKEPRPPRVTASLPPVRFYPPPYRPWIYFPGSTVCTCNKVCICIPVCQAHRLLHGDPVVSALAEYLVLQMGNAQTRYLEWASGSADGRLRARILRLRRDIAAGRRADPAGLPSINQCLSRLGHSDEVVAIMAAQALSFGGKAAPHLSQADRLQVHEMLCRSECRPWFIRHGVPIG